MIEDDGGGTGPGGYPGNGSSNPNGTPTGLPSVLPDDDLYLEPTASPGNALWPGEFIASLPFTKTWDSAGYEDLPGAYDSRPGSTSGGLPPTQINGSAGAVFAMVGNGSTVEFYAWSANLEGKNLIMQLLDFTRPEDPGSPNTSAWFKEAGSDADAGYPPSTGFRAFLVAGTTYYLHIGSGNYSETTGYGQVINLIVATSTEFPNDLRDDADDVIIPSDGATFKSRAIFSAEYTMVLNATDDPIGGYEYAAGTAWWRYVPATATTFSAIGYVGPDGTPDTVLAAYRMSGGGVLTMIEYQVGPPTVVTGSAAAGETIYFQLGIGTDGFRSIGHTYRLKVTGDRTTLQYPEYVPPPGDEDPGPYNPPDDVPWDSDDYELPPDKYKPDAVVKAETESGSSTLLDQVRQFSSIVKRAVRITGSHTIEMVDPAVPLPAGWANADAGSLYTTTLRTAAAEEKVLSIRAGDVKVSGGAHVKTDDVRIVKSTWRIPDRLPVFGLPAAPVKSITHTFSPTGYDSSVEFHFGGVPIEARRI